MSTKYESNLEDVISLFTNSIYEAMEECGRVGVKNIKRETPVDKGDLKKANEYIRPTKTSVRFQNNLDYAEFQELGTYLMNANPFFRRGLFASLNLFSKIIIKKLTI